MIAALPPAPPPALVSLLTRPRTKVVTANGLRFTYLEWGNPDGPLVLCLHGFPDSPATWRDLGPVLARAGYRVVAPWARGYYPTEAPADQDYATATQGRDALALITALGREKAVVIGHDWGALEAYAAATLDPAKVSKLVTVAIPHPGALSNGALKKATHFLTLPLPGAALRFASDDVSGVDRIIDKWSPAWKPSALERETAKAAFRRPGGTEAILGYYRSFAVGQLSQAWGQPPAITFGKLAMPTLTVYGEADGALDESMFAATPGFFTGSYAMVGLPGVGHFPQRERVEAFDGAVMGFLGAP